MPWKPMKNMTQVAKLVLKEIQRRGGHKALEAKLERAIQFAKEHTKREKEQKGTG